MNIADPPPALAVVIPAWRAKFLGEALDSLRKQTDQRFRVYIGDDASRDDLRALTETHGEGLDFVYHRFDGNLGSIDLVKHWHRCIALTEGEPWIWLFADDDVAEPDCVAEFLSALEIGDGSNDLYRFNLKLIGENSQWVRTPKPNPPFESDLELLAALLEGGGREWRAPEHIFSRSVYERLGGFINLPLALYTDLATWVEFAGRGGVVTLPKAHLRWRSHGHGTSSGHRIKNRDALLSALVGFLDWMHGFLSRNPNQISEASCLRFLGREIGRIQPAVPWSFTKVLIEKADRLAPHQKFRTCRVVFAVWFSRARHYPGISHLLYWRYRRSMA